MEYHGHTQETQILDAANAGLVAEAKQAEKDASEANENASKFNSQFERSKLELAKAESGRLELEKQVLELVEKTKTRNISPKARTDLALKLNGIPKGNVEVVMSDKDAECMAFGLEIKKTLIAANFPRVDFSPREIFRVFEMYPEQAISGMDMIFCVKDLSSPPLCSLITIDCLRKAGIKVEGGGYNDGLTTNGFQIFVLPKPTHPNE